MTATERSRTIALVVLCTGMLMIVLDSAIVNVALEPIQSDLGFSQASLAWVVNAYLIPFGGLLLLAGRLGDLIGRRTIFLVGLAVFTAASLACGLAQSQEMLVGARLLQGAGGALTSSVILGIIITMFTEPREQAKAIGVFSFVASAGASIGLLAGGILTQGIDWHWIFFVNVPIGVATALLALRYVERDQGLGLRAGADAVGGALITASLMLLVYTILETANYGWGSARTLGLGAARAGAAGGVRRAGVAYPQPARAAQHLPLARHRGSQRGPAAHRCRNLRHVLPRRALPPAGAGLRRARDRPGVPPRQHADRDSLARILRAPQRALWRNGGAGARARAPRDRAGRVRARAGRRQLPDRRPASDDSDRDRRRPVLPLAHHAGGVGRIPERVRPGVRAPQHDPAGGRSDRAGGAGNPCRHAHGRPRRGRRVQRLGAHGRLPPRVPDRGRARGGRDGRGAHGAGTRPGSRRRAGGGSAGRPS